MQAKSTDYRLESDYSFNRYCIHYTNPLNANIVAANFSCNAKFVFVKRSVGYVRA